MAYVKKIERDKNNIHSIHPTHVVCKVKASECDGRRLIQLDTYGSDNRKMPGKLSQTLQFDEVTGRQLFELLREHFKFG